MIIWISRRLGCVPDIDINIYDAVLPNLLKNDYLGVTVKLTLSWDLHIHKACSKLSQKVGLLGRLQSSVPNEMLKVVYQTCVQPTIDYCITVWGYPPATLIRKVQSFQNRAARIITGIRDWNIRGLTVVKQIGWMNVMERRDYFMGMLMHRCTYGSAPNYLKDLLYLVSDIHKVPTRSNTNGDFMCPTRT